MAKAAAADMKPKPRVYLEKIGEKEWELSEVKLDVIDEVALWSDNPRLQTRLPVSGISSEADIEAALQDTSGYENLRRSIDDLGQMEPIYVWRPNDTVKYIVVEGATRVCILRELDRRYTTGIKAGKSRRVRAKILPPNFGEMERVILLARIHVRGSGVRAWGRYIEAKFIHETVVEREGQPALMNVTQMAQYMEKSVSWVQRLRDAYEFGKRFVEHVDDDEAEQTAARHFSTLEEVSKAKLIGSHLRDYDNPKHDDLRTEVFDMVRNEVFREYRDARFLKDFHDDPDKWEQLKSGEKHIASRLAMEVKTNASSVKAKIASLEQQVRRAIDRGDIDFNEDDITALQRAIVHMHDQIHPGVRPFRVALKGTILALSEASMADVKALNIDELSEFQEALDYFNELVEKHGKVA